MSAKVDLRSVELIRKLVGYDTTSRNSNLELIDFVEEYLDGHGVRGTRIYSDDGRKANLFVTLGPEDEGGIILSGHVDVVPVDGQDWSTDPFDLVEKDGRLYGRGACDMKSFVAVSLAAVPEFLRRGLRTPIHLAISYDEEVGCLGVRRMIDWLNARGAKPKMCIVGEPTEMMPVVAHKGKYSFQAFVTGKECHSSLAPEGVNAVEYAAEAIAKLRSIARRIRETGPRDELFDMPHTTVHCGVVEGGSVLNIVPNACRFEFEYRYIPADDPDAIHAEFLDFVRNGLEPEMKAVDPAAGFRIETRSVMPGLDTAPDAEVVTFAKALAGRNDHGKVAYGTEAGLFQGQGGIPTVVCGPGSIAQAHKPDEFITLDQVAKAEAFMGSLMDRVCVSRG